MFKEEVIKLVKKVTGLDEFNIEVPPDSKMGDFAFPCFILSKKFKKNPVEIAKDLSTKIKPNKFIKEVKAVGPYLNFFVDKSRLTETTLKKILKEKEKFGTSNLGKKKKVLVEHTSTNPNAEPHVGRVRNAMIGDSIVRILKFQGYNVKTHFFVNDVGKQIAMLVLAAKGKKISFKALLKLYVDFNKKLVKQPELEKDVFNLLYQLEKGDSKVRKDFERIVKICIEGQKKVLEEIGIKFDSFDYESKYLWNKKTKDILDAILKKEDCFKDSNGQIVVNQEQFKPEMKSPYLVLTRSDGTSLYPLRDLAYSIEKMKKASKNIVILGEDQKLYFRQLASAMHLLGYDFPDVVHYSFVLLKSGKMSTRKGNLVLLSDFMKEALAKAENEVRKRKEIKKVKQTAKVIGYGALKYSILRVSPEKNVTFDWNTALSFDGETAPYIQYAHARSASILRKSKLDLSKADYSLLKEPEELKLIKELTNFPKVVSDAEKNLRPHLIAVYIYSLAKTFSEFYHHCQCIMDDKEISKARLSLVLSTKYVLKTGLSLLGIDSPERM
ncbi:MAG: arginine--tRNA ligase [Nanoarchaeota archaeon]|nr:arginine--tRNA ligase [Nanoarchaeota archaeon]MCG2717322.1 arginine--tRNA ligase [Nanoarchaeota archaeon]